MGGPLVCVVDDDDAVRLSIGLLIETLGLPVRCFSSALDVLADRETEMAEEMNRRHEVAPGIGS